MLVRLLELGKTPPGLGQVAFGFTCVGVLVSEDAPHPRHGVLEEFLGKYPIVSRASSGHQDHTHAVKILFLIRGLEAEPETVLTQNTFPSCQLLTHA